MDDAVGLGCADECPATVGGQIEGVAGDPLDAGPGEDGFLYRGLLRPASVQAAADL